MKLTLTALTIAATMFASSASALSTKVVERDKTADLQKLMDTNKCVKIEVLKI